MELTADELAGVVDVFGALTRPELAQAVSELAFKRGEEATDPDGLVDDAVASYHLVGFEPDGGVGPDGDSGAADGDEGARLLVPGPTAFPEIPEGAEDLPHIMDVPERDVDRDQLGETVADRFREETAVAVRSDNEAFVERLLDVSYELEVWASVDVSGARDRLTAWQDERE